MSDTLADGQSQGFDLIEFAKAIEDDSSDRFAPSYDSLMENNWVEFERNLVGIRDRLHEAKEQGKITTAIIGTGGTFQSKDVGNGYEPIGTLEESFDALQLPKDDTLHLDFFNLMNLDSSQMRPEHWAFLAKGIDRLYTEAGDLLDAVVVTHGTDTMDRGASYLSFALQGMKMPIIITGSQKPAFEKTGDARDQMERALTVAKIASREKVDEVMVVCGTKVSRGTWAIKQGDTTTNAYAPWNDPRQAHDSNDWEKAWDEGRFAELAPAFTDFGAGKPVGALTIASHARRRRQLGPYSSTLDIKGYSDVYPVIMSDKRPVGFAEHAIGQRVLTLVQLGSGTADDRLVEIATAAADYGKSSLVVSPFFDSVVETGTYAAGKGLGRNIKGINRPLPVINTSPRALDAKINYALSKLGLEFDSKEGMGPILSSEDLKAFYDLMESNLVGELVGNSSK